MAPSSYPNHTYSSEIARRSPTNPGQSHEAHRTSYTHETSSTRSSPPKEKPYAVQVSHSRKKPPCPYHTPIVDLHRQHNPAANLSPMERFLSNSRSENPVAMFDDLRIGTAASGGCTCGNASQRQSTSML